MADEHVTWDSKRLQDREKGATILPIEAALAQKICVAVAQVLHAGFGKVEITITHHQVQVIQTMVTDKLHV